MKTVIGLFETKTAARDALYKLEALGIDPEAVSVITGRQRGQEVETGMRNKPSEPANTTPDPTVSPASYATLSNWLMFPATNVIPGMAPDLGLTPAERGGLDRVGQGDEPNAIVLPDEFHEALKSWKIPREQAQEYERRVSAGSVMIAAQVVEEVLIPRVEAILHQEGAQDIAAI